VAERKKKYIPKAPTFKPWVLVEEGKPTRKFDLVEVENGSGHRQMAWWTGFEWDAGSWRISKDVVRWRMAIGTQLQSQSFGPRTNKY